MWIRGHSSDPLCTADNSCDVHYTFEYDALGRKKKVKVGNVTLSENIYSADRKGLLEEMNFGNGAKVRYAYDDFGRTTAIYVDEPGETSATPKYEFKYDARGIASVIKDNVLMMETRVTSDLADRPSESVTRDANGNLLHKNILNYDGKNRVKEFLDILPDTTHKTTYTYDADNRVTEVKFDNSDTHKVNYTYDLLNRITNRTVTNGVPYSTTFGYLAGDTVNYGANATTPLIATITQGTGANAMNFAYTYDNRGNIISETRTTAEHPNGVTTTYEYDELCQLTRVNDPNDPIADSVNGTTWVFTYDRGGNILRKDAYSYTTGSVSGNGVFYWVYTYDSIWKDLLKTITKYNQSDVALIDNSNAALTYDAIGNPLSDGTWTYTWEKGRQLKSMHNATTGVTMEFKYNHEGIRTQKVKKVNGTVTETTEYILKGKTVAAMKKNTDTYYFTYDASGKPVTVSFNGDEYTYVKNLQGDIVGILDASGDLVVEYKYDAWGDAVSIYSASTTVDSLAFDNPFRYRGYGYDEESGLYYLRSRYYSPSTDRFINEDCLISQRFHCSNIFCYCSNNPVMRIDACGNMWIGLISGINELTKAIKSAVDALPNIKENYKKSGRKLAYAKQAIASVFYLVGIRKSVTYNEQNGLLRIPNNTYAAKRFIAMSSYYESEFFFDYDWAEMMAKVAVNKYETETGKSFHTEISKVTYEVRVHAQFYVAGLFTTHTDITDVSTYEGKGKFSGFHVQWWIDTFYSWGFR